MNPAECLIEREKRGRALLSGARFKSGLLVFMDSFFCYCTPSLLKLMARLFESEFFFFYCVKLFVCLEFFSISRSIEVYVLDENY